MNGDEAQRNNAAAMNNRGNMGQRFVEKSGNYSPSTSYNYNNPRTSNANYLPQQQNMRNNNGKRLDNNNNKFRRPTQNNNNSNDRVIRQNDIIIRLLKEIRDRLPPPPESLQNGPAEDSNHGYEYQHDADHDQACEGAAAEPADNQPMPQDQAHDESLQDEDEDEERQPEGI
jgi:hypothetical protein